MRPALTQPFKNKTLEGIEHISTKQNGETQNEFCQHAWKRADKHTLAHLIKKNATFS